MTLRDKGTHAHAHKIKKFHFKIGNYRKHGVEAASWKVTCYPQRNFFGHSFLKEVSNAERPAAFSSC